MFNALRRLSFFALLVVFSVPACATSSSFVAFGRCVSEKINVDGNSVLHDVELAFYAADYVGAIEALSLKYGPAVVECSIDIFIEREGSKKSLSPDGYKALDRARAYRAVHS